MSLPILDASAWREFRGEPSCAGINKTSHLALVADTSGKLRNCFVKLLPLDYPSLLAEAIGWTLTRASNISSPPFAAIIMVPLNQLRSCMQLPVEFNSEEECPAWCCEIVAGKSLRQISNWAFWIARQRCLHSKDAREIASFDLWTDLQDRNYGNVIRSPSGGYISIDHETILHKLLWAPTGRSYLKRSLVEEAQRYLSSKDYQRFQVDMANAAERHKAGLEKVRLDLVDIIRKIYPNLSDELTQSVLSTLEQRAEAGWLAKTLGVIA